MIAPTKSLLARKNALSAPDYQLRVLNGLEEVSSVQFPLFENKLGEIGLAPLLPTQLEILQINLGKLCNQTCKHCHVDAGPDRKEIMVKETMQQCLAVLKNGPFHTLDITGGAPEMTPHFRWLVEEAAAMGKKVIVRCNLTIIVANPKYRDLPAFFKANRVEVVSSLPYFNSRKTDSQRGEGVFDRSIEALQLLNTEGYGVEGSGLVLNLVYNPTGAFLPPTQAGMERDFKRALKQQFGISFNQLLTITNMPISRFLEYLIESGNYEGYMEKLVTSFNPSAAAGVMCRNTLSVSWDGYLYDCDFNQMLDLKIGKDKPLHIREFDEKWLAKRGIILNQHCYGCTAGAGSSCGGATAQ
jgi:radical SAM/Cys-rich protein